MRKVASNTWGPPSWPIENWSLEFLGKDSKKCKGKITGQKKKGGRENLHSKLTSVKGS